MMKKVRESNMELFRILAMFLVLVVHADFLALGSPTKELFEENPTFFWGQYFFESLAIGCVNMFVLLSGWFGIKPSKKSFLNLIFQCLFFSLGIYMIIICIGETGITLKGILNCFYLLQPNWFIKAYIGLYIISPILNNFIENSSKRNIEYFLIAFFTYQTLFGWLFPSTSFIAGGYSIFSFIGLYTLAHYTKIYTPHFSSFSIKVDFLIYLLVSLFIMTTSGICKIFHLDYITNIMYEYSNPFVIVASLYLLLFFSKLKIKYNPIINIIAISNFAAYLFHANPNILHLYFIPYIKRIVSTFDGIGLLLVIFLSLIIIYLISIGLDRIRIFLWNKLRIIY